MDAYRSKPSTVGELIRLLENYDRDLPVVLSIGPEDASLETFVVNPRESVKGSRQTYLGDIDVLRIEFDADEP